MIFQCFYVRKDYDYARFLYYVILKTAEPYSIFYTVINRNFLESLKEGLQDRRCSDGLIFPFNNPAKPPFLTNVTNKTNLHEKLTQQFFKLHDNDKQTICITCNNTVISNDNNVLNKNLVTVCTSEEVNFQIIRHAANLGVNGYKEVSIETVEIHVIVLSFGYANIGKDAGVEKFYVVYGPKEKFLDVFHNFSYFGEDKCRTLP